MASGDQSFAKDSRLTARHEFLAAQKSARRRKTRNFIVLWRPNGLSRTRLGVTVSKRVAGAVGRNRLKRLVREVFRANRSGLPPGLDLVVIARPSAARLNHALVCRELLEAFRSLPRDPSRG